MTDGEAEVLLDVLDSEALSILSLLRDEPLAAKTVAERTGVSLKTAYRRLDALEDQGLLEARTMLDEQGNHYTAYSTALEAVVLEFDFEDGTVTADRQTDDVARFMDLWQGLQDT